MRSLLSRAHAEEPAAQPAIAQPNTAAPAPVVLPPIGPAQESLQAKLYETTERLALALMVRAEKDLEDTDAGGKGPTVQQLRDTVEFAMALLVKLPKLKPDDEDDEGVDILRQAMADPAKIVDRLQANPKFIEALRKKGWLAPPVKINHRPTRAQAAEREEFAARLAEQARDLPEDDDDTILQKMLGKGQL